MGYDMTEIGEKLADNYCKQIFDDAFFMPIPIRETSGFGMVRSSGWTSA